MKEGCDGIKDDICFAEHVRMNKHKLFVGDSRLTSHYFSVFTRVHMWKEIILFLKNSLCILSFLNHSQPTNHIYYSRSSWHGGSCYVHAGLPGHCQPRSTWLEALQLGLRLVLLVRLHGHTVEHTDHTQTICFQQYHMKNCNINKVKSTHPSGDLMRDSILRVAAPNSGL